MYGKQSDDYQENDELSLKSPLLDILNTSLPLDQKKEVERELLIYSRVFLA